MPNIQVTQAKLRHCGPMIRRLRLGQLSAWTDGQVSAHRTLRGVFAQSYWTRAWTIDGQVAGLMGAMGAQMSPFAFIWLALSEAAARHPLFIVKEGRVVLEDLMRTKVELHTTVLEADDAALRLAIFLGFRPPDTDEVVSRHGRRMMMTYAKETPECRCTFGDGSTVGIPMIYDRGAEL